ncbi:hypothetical protein [Streptomyces sp. NPDC046805]|uniref:hypothetical protein n=1 Tax=Streptomyces sp. NPDC046805 TaxID=3155134 RepID=UPI0033D15111
MVDQWKSGGDIAIWHVEEPPTDPGEQADAHEQQLQDAEETFASVNVIYATNPQAAADQARREACETSERIHRDLTDP